LTEKLMAYSCGWWRVSDC